MQVLQVQGSQRQPPLVQAQAAVFFSVFSMIDSPSVQRRTNGLCVPYHGTESSEKFGHDRRPRQSCGSGGRDRPLLSASRPAARTCATAWRNPALRWRRPPPLALHPLGAGGGLHAPGDQAAARPRCVGRSCQSPRTGRRSRRRARCEDRGAEGGARCARCPGGGMREEGTRPLPHPLGLRPLDGNHLFTAWAA